MKPWLDRSFVSQAVIITAACLGGWMMLVQPKVDGLAQAEAEIVAARSQAIGPNEAVLEQAAQQATSLRSRASMINLKSQVAADSSALYRQIMALAKEQGVSIRSLNTGADAAGPDDADVNATSIDIAMDGPYEAVARLIESVHDIGGFIRTSSLTMTPVEIDGQTVVSAQFVGEALRFNVPPVLLSMEKSAHVEH